MFKKIPKKICFLYFYVPIFVANVINLENSKDVWFLLNYGRYILKYGFPTIEPFTIHHNFSFIMQQWLSALIFYGFYSFLGKWGLLLVVQLVNILILYLLYKLCMLLSNNKVFMSTIITIITDLLLLGNYICIRPQIFDYVCLISILYIMEIFYTNKKSKLIYLLIPISLLEINLHSSLWFMIFLFLLPYLVSLIYDKFKNKEDNSYLKLIIIMLIMFAVGFINPYGIDSITYIFKSYGSVYLLQPVSELKAPALDLYSVSLLPSIITFVTLFSILVVYVLYKGNKIKLRHFLLLGGVIILALVSFRNYSFLVIGGIPFLASYLNKVKDRTDYKIKIPTKNYALAIIVLVVVAGGTLGYRGVNFKVPKNLKNSVNYILDNYNKKDITLFNDYSDGPYIEYRGLKTYIDTRAEIFIKKNNKKDDVLTEYYYLIDGDINYNHFMNKYKFTHLLVTKYDWLCAQLIKDKRYELVYSNKRYRLFVLKKETN